MDHRSWPPNWKPALDIILLSEAAEEAGASRWWLTARIAALKLSDAAEPVHLNSTTRAYFREIAKLPGYAYIKST